MKTPEDARRQKRIVIVVAGLFASVMVSLGVWSIFQGHHVGVTKRSVVVTLDGTAARWMGAVQACLGMLMLMIAMPNKTMAVRWALFWVALGGVSLFMALRTL